ncbi:MAG TPA: hypothetical protein VEU06_01480 [Micropepsaceae bacterium]|nr:hypothetical protein [Micropepsaceae bacterium]
MLGHFLGRHDHFRIGPARDPEVCAECLDRLEAALTEMREG